MMYELREYMKAIEGNIAKEEEVKVHTINNTMYFDDPDMTEGKLFKEYIATH